MLTLTAVAAAPPDAAAHSRNADMVISLHIIRMTGVAKWLCVRAAGGLIVRRIRAVATITLSATGSKNAPNGVAISHLRARYPSNQSVKEAATNSTAQENGAYGISTDQSTIIKGTNASLNRVSMFGNVHKGCRGKRGFSLTCSQA